MISSIGLRQAAQQRRASHMVACASSFSAPRREGRVQSRRRRMMMSRLKCNVRASCAHVTRTNSTVVSLCCRFLGWHAAVVFHFSARALWLGWRLRCFHSGGDIVKQCRGRVLPKWYPRLGGPDFDFARARSHVHSGRRMSRLACLRHLRHKIQ